MGSLRFASQDQLQPVSAWLVSVKRRWQPHAFWSLGYDHESRECKGPDCRALYYKCGGGAHKVLGCITSPKFFLCTGSEKSTVATAHIAGSGVCMAFHEALAKFSRSP